MARPAFHSSAAAYSTSTPPTARAMPGPGNRPVAPEATPSSCRLRRRNVAAYSSSAQSLGGTPVNPSSCQRAATDS
jgi:hypothetical protein